MFPTCHAKGLLKRILNGWILQTNWLIYLLSYQWTPRCKSQVWRIWRIRHNRETLTLGVLRETLRLPGKFTFLSKKVNAHYLFFKYLIESLNFSIQKFCHCVSCSKIILGSDWHFSLATQQTEKRGSLETQPQRDSQRAGYKARHGTWLNWRLKIPSQWRC